MAETWFQKKYGYKIKVDNRQKYFGETDTKRKVIKINVRKSKKTKQKGELTDSILHETLHARHPKKSERAITKMTARTKLSKKSRTKLLKLIK